MTKKDYVKFAKAFKCVFDEGFKNEGEASMFWKMVDVTSHIFYGDCPKFDEEKYIDAIDPVDALDNPICPTCKNKTSKTLTIDGTYVCDICSDEWDSGR